MPEEINFAEHSAVLLTACCGDNHKNVADCPIYSVTVKEKGVVEVAGKEYQSATLYGWPGQQVTVTLPNKNVEQCAAIYLNGVFLCFARHIGEVVGCMTGDILRAKLEKHDKAVKILLLHLLQHELPIGKLLDYVNCSVISEKMFSDKIEGWDEITIRQADQLLKRLYGDDK